MDGDMDIGGAVIMEGGEVVRGGLLRSGDGKIIQLSCDIAHANGL
jgi:hypothetical protein